MVVGKEDFGWDAMVFRGEGGRMLREDQSLPNGVCKKEPDKPGVS